MTALFALWALYGLLPAIVCMTFSNPEQMCTIAYKESRFQPVSNGNHIGWWQIDEAHLARLGLGGYNLYNPFTNAAVAKELARERPDLSDWESTR